MCVYASKMAENLFGFAIVFLAVTMSATAKLDGKLAKKDIEDRGPVLTAILENLFLPKECIYYSKMSLPDRSMDYRGLDSVLCDNKLSEGWYRFMGSAGSSLATTCVPQDRCKAINPGWLAGEHPSIKDGKVERTVCFNVDGKCCHASVKVHVRNCGPFYVYKLVSVPCPFRYCGGHFNSPLAMPEVPEVTGELGTTTLPPFATLPSMPTFPPPLEDECVQYKILDGSDRAASFNNLSVVQGDFTLSTGWYRFTLGAGTKMADKCVQVFHCGTHAPGWLLGGHPTNAKDHAVQREVCFNWYNNCCLFKGTVLVRQCSDFFVYRLRPMDYKYLRYCGNA